MTGGISATRQPPLNPRDMPFPSQNEESLCPLPSVNLISWPMSLSCRWGQGLGGGEGYEFIAICPVTPTGCRAGLPLVTCSELCCSGRAGGACGWGWFSVNVLIA